MNCTAIVALRLAAIHQYLHKKKIFFPVLARLLLASNSIDIDSRFSQTFLMIADVPPNVWPQPVCFMWHEEAWQPAQHPAENQLETLHRRT